MEQTSLNLVAIAVFVMTISALLSPIFNISPFIPAATTLGLLGLATVDSLSWKGRGFTLLLDYFTSPEERQRVIHHEAGHFLAAYCLGIPITGYTLSAWEAFKQGQSGLGGVQFDLNELAKLNIRETPIIVERTLTVLMAGIAAEIIIYGKANGGEEDRQNLRAIMKEIGVPGEIHQQKESWATLQAKNLLSRQEKAYHALIEMMKNRASVEDCCQLIQENLS